LGHGAQRIHVELKPDAQVDQSEAQNALRDILMNYPGLNVEVVTFLGDRLERKSHRRDVADGGERLR
jgi:hypothetical protein